LRLTLLATDGRYDARERTAGADVDVCFGVRVARRRIRLL
jgi:hypothetical protein